MTDAELKQQPRSVREEFERIKDGEIDHDQQIVAMKTRLAEARAKLRSVQAAHDNFRRCIDWLQNGIASAEMMKTHRDKALTPDEKRQRIDELIAEKNRLLKATVQDAEAAQKGRM